MKFVVKEDVGEVKGDQCQAGRCYIEFLKIADKALYKWLERVKEDDLESKKCKIAEADTPGSFKIKLLTVQEPAIPVPNRRFTFPKIWNQNQTV
ncbi:hypothetical protein ACS0TY_013436 [Phlomoides rotata]